MVKVILDGTTGRRVDLFPENTTFGEVMESLGVDSSCGVNSVNGELITVGMLNETLHQFGDHIDLRIEYCPEAKVDELPFPEAEPSVLYDEDKLMEADRMIRSIRLDLDKVIEMMNELTKDLPPF